MYRVGAYCKFFLNSTHDIGSVLPAEESSLLVPSAAFASVIGSERGRSIHNLSTSANVRRGRVPRRALIPIYRRDALRAFAYIRNIRRHLC